MLFPQPSISSFKNALEAICYQKNQTDTFRLFSSSPLQVNARKTVHFSFFPSRANAVMADEELMLRIKAACMHAYFMRQCLRTIDCTKRGLGYINQVGAFIKNQGGFHRCDCLIYLVITAQFIKSDLALALELLAPHQPLIIAILINGTTDRSGEMECMVKFLQSLGDFSSSPLAATPIQWRIWCIKYYEENFINWPDLLEWGLFDVISKRIAGGCNSGSVLTKEQLT